MKSVKKEGIAINVPCKEETRNLVNEHFISNMKCGASLVNTARGQIIGDVDILYKPSKANRLSCVALDVLPDESPKDSMLLRAWKNREEWLDGRLIINPRTAGYSKQSFHEMRYKTVTNAKRIVDGMKPLNIVN